MRGQPVRGSWSSSLGAVALVAVPTASAGIPCPARSSGSRFRRSPPSPSAGPTAGDRPEVRRHARERTSGRSTLDPDGAMQDRMPVTTTPARHTHAANAMSTSMSTKSEESAAFHGSPPLHRRVHLPGQDARRDVERRRPSETEEVGGRDSPGQVLHPEAGERRGRSSSRQLPPRRPSPASVARATGACRRRRPRPGSARAPSSQSRPRRRRAGPATSIRPHGWTLPP